MDNNTLTQALKHFEIAEANLVKLERLWKEIKKIIPEDVVFFDSEQSEYDEKVRYYEDILLHLPKINDWVPTASPEDLNTIAQLRFDCLEIGEISSTIATDQHIMKPGTELAKYRFLLKQKRSQLVREAVTLLTESIDDDLLVIRNKIINGCNPLSMIEEWEIFKEHIGQIDMLLGSPERPTKWNDLQRHIRFAEMHDFDDIEKTDWPTIKKQIQKSVYGENDPIPSEVTDLDSLVSAKPKGVISKQLMWSNLTPEDFERLIYTLFSHASGYENCNWLTKTNATDRGRDLSVQRILKDSLGGVTRQRVIVQCKHWQAKSISLSDVQMLQAQMKLWEPPLVDIHIIVSSGRFTTDAIAFIEKINQSDNALRIEMWPESHLETILASRPDLIAEFRLR